MNLAFSNETKRESLRIALVTETWPPEVNGVAMTMSRLADGLRNRGHHVQVIRPRQKSDSIPKESADILVKGLPLPGYAGLQLGWPAGQTLTRLWQTQRPDVVHTVTEGPLGWSALQIARKLRLPVTSSYHTNFDSYSKHYGVAMVAPFVKAWLMRFHRRTLSTMAPTQTLVNNLTKASIPGASLLGRGVDTALFHPSRRNEALRGTWGAVDQAPVVLYVGRIASEKNLDLAARAFEAIRELDERVRMVWVGDGPARAPLSRRFPHHIFSGAKRGNELATHYASADLFLFPSLTETYGNVVPEAMASGLAVVAYDTAAAAELITPGRDGLTVPPEDEEAFIAAAVRMARTHPLLQSCRREARTRVEPISWDTVILDFETALRGAALHTWG